MEQHLPAFLWPLQSHTALEYFIAKDVVVIYITVPENIERDAARQSLRLALTEMLVSAFDCPAQQIRIISIIAKGNFALVAEQELFISMSYEAGIAIAAISAKNQLGIDILRLTPEIEWQDLARLYLGEQKTSEILAAPVLNQFRLFTKYWTQLEAKLKSNGMTLTEHENQISAANRHLFADTELFSLQVPETYVASLALLTMH
ncbi:hypothetical protein H8K32_02395 [Undibacterium jejuense]|uniref:4'-phosphopantetheinyl transferase domain-containing protein n=1 Tax=Undibacterium jejuense TaxID=1344949 RepID=A0A923KNT4_9BURK|nr:hypothetical protein [Undibacterium jejuense]MBC3860936.1 hypothetical protein [Undibacterium jejuense]